MTQICPFFGLCGGCKHQNLTPTEYRQLKINFVQNILKNNKIEHEIEDFIEIPAHTRRRITLALENGVVGFNAHHSHQIIPVDKCPILTPELEKLLPELQKISKGFSSFSATKRTFLLPMYLLLLGLYSVITKLISWPAYLERSFSYTSETRLAGMKILTSSTTTQIPPSNT